MTNEDRQELDRLLLDFARSHYGYSSSARSSVQAAHNVVAWIEARERASSDVWRVRCDDLKAQLAMKGER